MKPGIIKDTNLASCCELVISAFLIVGLLVLILYNTAEVPHISGLYLACYYLIAFAILAIYYITASAIQHYRIFKSKRSLMK